MKKPNLIRTQVLLTPDQVRELTRIAVEEKKSVSSLLREWVNRALMQRQQETLARAARDLADNYYSDGELVGYSHGDDDFQVRG
jgi:hypothetical protein